MFHRRLARLSLALCLLLLLTPLAGAAPPEVQVANPAVPPYLLACEDHRDGYWSTVSTEPMEVLGCQLTVPVGGYVFITANTGTDVEDAADTNLFKLNIKLDGSLNTTSERQASNGPDGVNGTDHTMTLSHVTWLTAGQHTIRLMATWLNGTGPVRLLDPTLAAIYMPDTRAIQLADTDAGVDTTLVSSVPVTVTSGTVSGTEPGWVYIATEATISHFNGAYEGRMNVSLDSTAMSSANDRYVSINGGLASGYKTIAYSALRPLTTPGAHTVRVMMARYADDGVQATVTNNNLTLLHIPAASGLVTATGTYGNISTQIPDTTHVVLRAITVTVPAAGWVFASADATATCTEYAEGRFRLGFDSTTGDTNTDRYVDVNPLKSEQVSLAYLKWLPAGQHTIYLVGWRTNGSGLLNINDATLTVIIPGGHTDIPYVEK